jgi:hypothetical protein
MNRAWQIATESRVPVIPYDRHVSRLTSSRKESSGSPAGAVHSMTGRIEARKHPVKKALIFAGFFVVHSVAQFWSWAYALRDNTASQFWDILSAPLVPLSGYLTSQYFWVVAELNSLLWAAVLSFVIFRFFMEP